MILFIYMIVMLIVGVFGCIYSFQMLHVLNEEGISTCSFELTFSYNKFRKFIEICNGEKKIKYTKLYKKSLWFKRMYLLLFVFFIILLFVSSIR